MSPDPILAAGTAYCIPGSCLVQGESRITSHLHYIATSGIAYCQISNQAQARPGGQDRQRPSLFKAEKKKKELNAFQDPEAVLFLFSREWASYIFPMHSTPVTASLEYLLIW